MRFRRAVGVIALLSSPGLATDPLTLDKIEADITTDGLQHVLWNLDKIAQDNGGNRAFGEPGFKASVDFVLERTVKRFGRSIDTFVQSFNHTYAKTREIKVTGPEGEDVFVVSPLFNPGTPLPGGITASLINTPVNDQTGSMCLEEQWNGIDATGKLALVKRGECAVADKLKFARAHGAMGVILYNQDPGTDYAIPTLGSENIGQVIPVGIIPLDIGQRWAARLDSGNDVKVKLVVDAVAEYRESWNIIAETKEGDPNKVIMVGAHLDSVQAGAGINDDGSGTAAILEILGSVQKYQGFPHKLRFAWWGAEESGLIGSLYYTSQLPPAEVDKIKYYFNYDMIGSPAPIFAIASAQNSGIGPQLLEEYLVAKGKNVTHGGFGGGSDHVGFLQLGIPAAGLHTGGGIPADPCYHLACDTFNNIHWEALTTNTKAAARALAKLAHSLDGVPPRATTTVNPRSQRGTASAFKVLAEKASHVHMCSHGKEKLTA